MLRTIRRGLWGLLAALALASAAAAQGTPATAPAAAAGKPVVVQFRTDSPTELLAVANLLHRDKQYARAFELASRAYGLAKTRDLRFRAALVAADSSAGVKKFMRAKLWLRFADQNARTEADSDLVAKLYRAVARRDPLSFQADFTATPSNNVNNGAETTIIQIAGLPFVLSDSEQQLGGVRAAARLTAIYRLSETRTERTDLIADAFTRKVWLDAQARDKAPDVQNSDFAQDTLALGFRHIRLIWPEVGPTSFTVLGGRNWYGGAVLSDVTQLEVGQALRRSKDTVLRFAVGLRREISAASSVSDVDTTSFVATYDRLARDRWGYALTGFLRNAVSESATADYKAAGFVARLNLPGTAALTPRLSLTGDSRDYRKWTITSGGRLDRSLSEEERAWEGVS